MARIIQERNPNRLVKIVNTQGLKEQLSELDKSCEDLSMQAPLNVGRKKLPGATGYMQISQQDDSLTMEWRGGDGNRYQATLLGLNNGYAVVTNHSLEQQVVGKAKKEGSYARWA